MEYEVASGGRIQVEIVDPRDHPDIEAEAGQVYGIRPTPFQVAGRYEQSVINSYFDVLIRYGDQHVVLGFGDLIEVTPGAGTQLEVGLRNPEYDLTRSIKKVVYGFQSLDKVFASIQEPVRMTAYMSPETMPAEFAEVPALVQNVAAQIGAESNGKFIYTEVNPDDPSAGVSRQQLYDQYGCSPSPLPSSRPELLHARGLEFARAPRASDYPSPSMGRQSSARRFEPPATRCPGS